MSKPDSEEKKKFRLFYLSRPWLPFDATLVEACKIAFDKAERFSDVKLTKVGGEEVDFKKILKTAAVKQQ